MYALTHAPAPEEPAAISKELRAEINDLLLDPDVSLPNKLGELRLIGMQVELERRRKRGSIRK